LKNRFHPVTDRSASPPLLVTEELVGGDDGRRGEERLLSWLVMSEE